MSSRPSAVTIGFFDGVHLGHRRLVAELTRVAAARGLRAVVVTFDRHPASIVRPGSAPPLLTDLEQRVELLCGAGADEVRVLPFDEERAAEEAPDFVREVLAGELAARAVIVGRDFHFGHGRRGNVALLREMGGELGFEVIPYELVPDPEAGEVVSSTRIRSLLAAGDVEAAARLLGRPHEVRGEVLPAPGAASPADGRDRTRLSVPADVAVPAPGRYQVELAPGDPDVPGGGGLEGVAIVDGRGEAGEQLLELPPAAGDAVWSDGRARVRFLAPAATVDGVIEHRPGT